MSDALYLASERQQSNPITIISTGVAANYHRHCYENTPLHRLFLQGWHPLFTGM